MRFKPYQYPEMPPADCQVCGQPFTPYHKCVLVASYRDAGNSWRGVLRDRITREPVAEVLGSFRNRDQGNSAVNAARRILNDMQRGARTT